MDVNHVEKNLYVQVKEAWQSDSIIPTVKEQSFILKDQEYSNGSVVN
jgi:hypothetical protein